MLPFKDLSFIKLIGNHCLFLFSFPFGIFKCACDYVFSGMSPFRLMPNLWLRILLSYHICNMPIKFSFVALSNAVSDKKKSTKSFKISSLNDAKKCITYLIAECFLTSTTVLQVMGINNIPKKIPHPQIFQDRNT